MASRIKVIKTRILMRRDSAENWMTVNPILASGEIGYDATVKKHKIGDGLHHWDDLPYFALETDLNDVVTSYVATKVEWDANRDLVSRMGVFYIYSDYQTYEKDGQMVSIPGVKIGDGTTYLIDLPFMTQRLVDMLTAHINDTTIHVTQAEKDFWNNKVTCYLNLDDEEHIIFDKS